MATFTMASREGVGRARLAGRWDWLAEESQRDVRESG